MVAGGLGGLISSTATTVSAARQSKQDTSRARSLAVILLIAVSYAKDHFGDAGLFTVAAFSGLTAMDAITLSTAGLSHQGDLDPSTAWRVILTGGLANVVFKAVLVSVMGSKELLKPALIGFAAILLGGMAILWFWP